MPILPIPQYRPDVSDYEAENGASLSNVLPRGDGYGPFKTTSVYTSALAAACRGYFFARKNDGSVTVFAASSTRIYQLDNTAGTWTDVSKGGSAYTAVPNSDQWQFAQFGNYVVAVQLNVAPQVFDITSSSAFDDLAGSPPQARYVTVVNGFLVLSGLGTSVPYRVQWSALNDITNWTSGSNQSDYQDFADGGIVRGVAGGEYGYIFQDGAIRRLTYAPGDPRVFLIDRITEDRGLFAPLSIARAGDRVFFVGNDGFQQLTPGSTPQPIGRERVDRTFLADIDTGNLQLCMACVDPKASRVYWPYKSNNGTSGRFDKMLCYDWVLDRWAPITTSGEYMANISQPGLTLENLDSISGSLDALPFASLDDISTATLSQISCFDASHKLAFFTGSNLEATVVTATKSGDGRRVRVKGFRPITDSATVYGSVSSRETLSATESYGTEVAMNAAGHVFQNVSTRYMRAKSRIPAATTWTFITGAEMNAAPEGRW